MYIQYFSNFNACAPLQLVSKGHLISNTGQDRATGKRKKNVRDDMNESCAKHEKRVEASWRGLHPTVGGELVKW